MTARTKSLALLLLKILVAVGLLVLVLTSARMRGIDWDGFADRIGQWPLVVAAFAIACVIPLIGTTRWYLLLKCLGCHPSFPRTLHLHLAGTFFNCIGLGYAGGDIAKACYLFRGQAPGRRAEVVYATLFDRAVGLFSLLLIGIAVMVANYSSVQRDASMRIALQVMGITAAALAIGFLILRPVKLLNTPADESLVRRLLLALRAYRTRYAVVFAAIGLSLAAHGITVVALFSLGRALGMPSVGPSRFVFYVITGLAFSSFGPLMGAGFGQFAFAELFEYEWGAQGYQFGVFLATIYQMTVLSCNLLLGLPAFLSLRHRTANEDSEAASPHGEDALADPGSRC